MPSHASTELRAEDSFPDVAVDAVTIIGPRIGYFIWTIRVVFLVVLHLELRGTSEQRVLKLSQDCPVKGGELRPRGLLFRRLSRRNLG